MTTHKWWWLALGGLVSIVTAIFLDLNANPPTRSGEIETATNMKAPLEHATATNAVPTPPSSPGSMRSTPAGESEIPEEISTPRNAIQEARKPVRLYRDARIQPVYDLATNRVEGVRIVDVAPDSFWSELGVRSHDVILEFNGLVIETPSATVALMNAVSEGHRLSLRIRSAEGEVRFAEYNSPR